MNTKRLLIITGTVFIGLTLALLLSFHSSLTGVTIANAAGPWYVTPGGDDDNTCQSVSKPCRTINSAIGKASSGDTVYVAVGTYTPLGDDWMTINKDITLSGGWDGTFTTQGDTSIIDGQGTGNRIGVGENVTAIIDRFIVQNDGGINNYGVLTLTNSILRDNTGDVGGGIWSAEGTSTTIIDSQIYGNEVEEDGGGIFLFNCCGFNSDLTLIRSWVVGNAAPNGDGGGIWIDEGSSATIENSIIAGNFAGRNGGGVKFYVGGPYRIINSHIVGNESNEEGAAIVGRAAEIVVTNTLIISNTGQNGIDDPWEDGSVFTLDYCDTYGNSPDGVFGVTITRNNCLGTPQEYGLDPMMVGGPLPSGVGPAFADQWMNYDYRLLPGSPAIDAVPVEECTLTTDLRGILRPQGIACDIGAFEFELEQIEVDIDIKPGSGKSCFNNDGHGVIPVAVLGNADFDVHTIDPSTVLLQGLAVAAKGKLNKLLAAYEDVNGDGYPDLVIKIEDVAGAFTQGSGTAVLTGNLYDGTPIFGVGDICITQ